MLFLLVSALYVRTLFYSGGEKKTQQIAKNYDAHTERDGRTYKKYHIKNTNGEEYQFDVIVSDTEVLREKGLGGRENLASNEAMLFVFDHDNEWSFWMKDMLFPIDIIWLNSDMRIVDIERNVSHKSYPTVFSPNTPTRFVLEVQAGLSDKIGLKKGSVLREIKL